MSRREWPGQAVANPEALAAAITVVTATRAGFIVEGLSDPGTVQALFAGAFLLVDELLARVDDPDTTLAEIALVNAVRDN